jgi:hypothetical protein
VGHAALARGSLSLARAQSSSKEVSSKAVKQPQPLKVASLSREAASLLYCLTALLLYYFTTLLLYCFTALLLDCFPAFLLYVLLAYFFPKLGNEARARVVSLGASLCEHRERLAVASLSLCANREGLDAAAAASLFSLYTRTREACNSALLFIRA